MTPNELPTSTEELRQFALDALRQMKSAHDAKEKLQREVIIAKPQAIELISTVEAQKNRMRFTGRVRFLHPTRSKDASTHYKCHQIDGEAVAFSGQTRDRKNPVDLGILATRDFDLVSPSG